MEFSCLQHLWSVHACGAVQPAGCCTSVATGSHVDQLTLWEFTAFHTRDIVENVDLLAESRCKPPGASKGLRTEEENVDDDGAERAAPDLNFDLEGSLDEVPDDDVDYEDGVAEQIKYPFATVTDVLDVVLRVQEINEEGKPGREADWKKNARSYVSLYGDSFAQRVPLHAAQGLPTRAAGQVFGCSDIGDALRQQDV